MVSTSHVWMYAFVQPVQVCIHNCKMNTDAIYCKNFTCFPVHLAMATCSFFSLILERDGREDTSDKYGLTALMSAVAACNKVHR